MTMPVSTRSLRYPCGAVISSTAMRNMLLDSVQLARRLFPLRRRVVDLNRGPGPQCTERFVAANDDFVSILQSAGNFYIRHACDTRLHRDELSLLRANNKNPLEIGLFSVRVRP